MAYTLLFLSFFFQFSLDTSEPTIRLMVNVNHAQEACFESWWALEENAGRAFYKKQLSIEDWYVVEIRQSRRKDLESLACVFFVSEDKKIEWRINPNDPSFISQIDMELIGMPDAWDISKGGVTSLGDTIVVAVIDNGFQPDHVDLVQNIWKNKHEIPNDDIDNDLNDYVDDYLGVNIITDDDVHPPGNHHGTSVSGIIGAKGNNHTGVAGVNWNVKLLLISGANFESQLIESYEYVYQLRRRHRITNGEEGAFIVVTNLSGGINNEFAVDHPLWCNMYDKLGEEGILSVTAAPNMSISVDADGDMPTTCTSDYMIAVTNVDLTDQIVGNAGFGPESIDLAAPGHGTVTTGGNNTYRDFPGTSAAAPHVTGAIALLYSSPCSGLLQNVRTDPAGVALKVKDIILQTGENNNSLQDITVTGKRLNVEAAMAESIATCDTLGEPGVSIISVQPNPTLQGPIKVIFAITGDTTSAFFELNSLDGKLIKSFPISSAEFSQGYIELFAREPLPAGLYLLTLRNQKKKSTVKIISGF